MEEAPEAECVIPPSDAFGECLAWSSVRWRLAWPDSVKPRIRSFDPGRGTRPSCPGGIAPLELDTLDEVSVAAAFTNDGTLYYNNVSVDRARWLWTAADERPTNKPVAMLISAIVNG